MRSILVLLALFVVSLQQIPIPRDPEPKVSIKDRNALYQYQANRRHRARHRPAQNTIVDPYRKQREEIKKYNEQVTDQYYQQYFDRMRDYAVQVHRMRYGQLLDQQDREKNRFAQNMREFGISDESVEPRSPFGDASSKAQLNEPRAAAVTLMKPPSQVDPRPENRGVHAKALQLEQLCTRFLPTVRKHCYGGNQTEIKYASKCKGYFHDCQTFLPKEDPLYNIAYGFTSNVGLNLGTWDVKGIPYYPINEEGAIGAGRLMNVPFGSWGGGYSDHIGVRDYWSQYQEVGANWYEGKYGYKSGWSVPLVQSLGIEGDTHAVVSVPIKPGELGKPVGVDVGGGVGPYYQQNQHVGVDYMRGQVGTNFGVGVPMAGVGVNHGVGVSFPSIEDIVGKR